MNLCCFSFAAVAAAFALSGCAGGVGGNANGAVSPSVIPDSAAIRQSFAKQSVVSDGASGASQRYVYVADYDANAVDIFDAGQLHGSPVGQITYLVHEPTGIFVDANKTLYVENNDPNTLTEYRNGVLIAKIALGNLDRPGAGYWEPRWITVDSNGTVYISAWPSHGDASGAVIEYDKGSGTISRTLALPPPTKGAGPGGPSDPSGLAVDANDNLYLLWGSGCGACGYGVSRFAPGATSYTQGTNVDASYGYAAGLTYDAALGEVLFGSPGSGFVQTVLLSSGTTGRFADRASGGFGGYLAADPRNGYLYVGANPLGEYSYQREILVYDIASQNLIGTLSGFSSVTTGIAVEP